LTEIFTRFFIGSRIIVIMALVHPQSCECVKSELDLFSVPPTQTSVEQGVWTEHHPISSLTDAGPIEFVIAGSGGEYVDLANTQLQVRAKIVKADGTALGVDDDVGPVNLWLHSLFSQVDVSLNDKLVSPSTNTYAYRAYIESLLTYGSDAKTSQLTSALWYKDTAGQMDSTATTDAGPNAGLVKRTEFSQLGRVVDLLGTIHSDMFCQERYLVNGVSLRMRLVRNKDAFALMSGAAGYKINIVSAVLHARKVKLSPTIVLAHAKALERGNIKYPIRRVDCKVFSVPTGNMSTNQENLFLGQMPTRIVVGCVDNDAFNGSYRKNPFHFKHYHLNHLALHLDGQSEPIKPLSPHFPRQTVRAFTSLFSGTGKLFKDEGIDIDREDYIDGYTLYAFDLTPDLAEGGSHFNLTQHGSLRLEMKFGQPLPNTINVIVYSEWESMVEVDRSKNVVFDYAN